ncbi:MAG: ABC transporter permease [Longimicrobiales bacterium]
MLTGFWKLTWIETKVFVREPMGLVGLLIVPVIVFLVAGWAVGAGPPSAGVAGPPFNVPVLAALSIAVSAVQSLVAIMSIYREGGILKRLRATPLSPVTILSAHVFVKLTFTVLGLALLVLAGRQFFPGAMAVGLVSFTLAVLLSTLSILSLGFIIASVVPTARFAQPISGALLYPMVAFSGLFFPLQVLPVPLRIVANALPTTHAAALMEGIWDGAGWGAHTGSVLALVVIGGVCTLVSTKVFRWE